MTESRKNINRFDSFTQCRSAVIGQINWTLIDLIEDPVKREYTKLYLEDLNETFDHLLDICKQFDIHVDRPTVIPYNPQKKYVHPNFELSAIKNPITTSDTFLCLADTIVEVPSVQENAYFETAELCISFWDLSVFPDREGSRLSILYVRWVYHPGQAVRYLKSVYFYRNP